MDAAVAALCGTALGVVGTVGTAWLQQRKQGRREIMKLAAEVAMKDYERRLELMDRAGDGGRMPPIAIYVAYQFDLLMALESGPIGPGTLASLREKNDALITALNALNKQ